MAEQPMRASNNFWTDEAELPGLVKTSDKLRALVDVVGRFGSWFILPLVLITCYDVLLRKLKFFYVWVLETFGRVWIFESTLLQEMEWHMHTVLFTLVLGYGYIHNSHVRVDLVREKLSFRRKAWLELLGTSFFLIPYTCIVLWFACIYAYDAYMTDEISASLVGLSHRWIIKSVLVVGLVLAAVAGIAVWLQTAAVLWGRQDQRYPLMTMEWPEFAGSTIEGKRRLVLDEEGNVVVDPSADPDDLELPPEVAVPSRAA
ncbi:MAG: TRAP transporter small permease subunit [Immundisolibacterales bacterium]|nr:TRAP transporter small permease subunit [Immundisolibacterales bacterium]